MDINSAQFQQFVKHILSFEGGLSKDPRDTAVKYAPFPGAYHTNKGVTYGAFVALAPKLGITPVNYERFLKLSDQDVAKFIYQFYTSINGQKLPGAVGLSVAEAAWGSGPVVAIRQLRQTVNSVLRHLRPYRLPKRRIYTTPSGKYAGRLSIHSPPRNPTPFMRRAGTGGSILF